MKQPLKCRKGTCGNRQGAAMVELAVCLPLLMIISFGAIETANAIFLKQIIAQVAYEGARTAAQPDSTVGEIQNCCKAIYTARRIKGVTVTVTPKNLSPSTPKGSIITITVSAPSNANTISPSAYFKASIMTKKVVMTRI